ncbi:hypothetical protein [Luteibaculum oceani]|uniref:Uncharacterized protein n=1 Tax=Luteibaculum oceani TaxID=1294296 RepID=A0A5C6V1F3_9FLAO|nr:hypothetical protein [Luteibaculum oceani]TXC78680.1 hypothetical protein FRX97_08150 [Luteibaculum oceani]
MEAPKIPGLFKSKGPKSFHFKPRYYDEQKERIAKRRAQIKRELVAEGKLDTSEKDLFNRLERRHRSHISYRKSAKKSNIRITMILIGLLIILFWLWNESGGIL